MSPPQSAESAGLAADAPERDESLTTEPSNTTRAKAQRQPRLCSLPADKEARARTKHAFAEMILADEVLTPLQKNLGSVLVRRVFDGDGFAYEDASVLGALLGVTRQAIGVAGKALETRGYFDVLRRRGRGNVNEYYPQWDKVTEPRPLATRLEKIRSEIGKMSSGDYIFNARRRAKCHPRAAENVIHGGAKMSSPDGTTSTTSEKNSESAREAFESLFDLMPEASRRGSSKPLWWSHWQRVADKPSTEALAKAILAYGDDRTIRHDKAHFWLSQAQFREYLRSPAPPSRYEPPSVHDGIPWPMRVEFWNRDRSWQSAWGPPPGEWGCMLPEELKSQIKPIVRRDATGMPMLGYTG